MLLVDEDGGIVWQYGKAGVSGFGFDELNTPVQNTWLPNHHVLFGLLLKVIDLFTARAFIT